MRVVKISAGLLMYSEENNKINVFLVHPGGPYFSGKDSWGIPKGEIDFSNGENKENLLKIAKREFEEETGLEAKAVNGFISLGFLKRTGGKTVHVWAFKGNGKEKFLKSNYFELEWPEKSGDIKKFPESDDGKYFNMAMAQRKIHKYQAGFLDRLKIELEKMPRSANNFTQNKLV